MKRLRKKVDLFGWQNNAYFLVAALIIACQPPTRENQTLEAELNPPSPGFNATASDLRAIGLADSVMQAMGGRAKWDRTRYLAWNFFGRRDLVWDKSTGRVRIDYPGENTVYLLNINDNQGVVYKNRQAIQGADSLQLMLNRGKSIWINDSYWLVMPFKLKDSGVTLKYLREDTTRQGILSHVLGLTFEGVGDTPDNRYEVFIDQSDHLVKQWAYFEQASQDSASRVWPWDNYRQYEEILLSGDRSDGGGPKNVQVFETMSDSVFIKVERPPFLQP